MKNTSKYYHKRRNLLIELFGGKCVKCGSKECLQFDHIKKSEKEFDIFKNWSYSIQRVLKELSKCQLLCSLCHKEKNKKDNGEAVHGSLSMYTHYKCRCRPCMDAYNISRKKWRATARLKGKIW